MIRKIVKSQQDQCYKDESQGFCENINTGLRFDLESQEQGLGLPVHQDSLA